MAAITRSSIAGRERGQTIVILALALITLAAFVGLATDAALVYTARGQLQRAVDAAALAAANKLPDRNDARRAANEFMRLHGYDFENSPHPLEVAFPIEDTPRKLAVVTGTLEVDLAFLRVVGWRTTTVTAQAEGESAPLDVFVVLDLSESMVYDTPRPRCWPNCCPKACPKCTSSDSWDQCQAYYCNRVHNCDPLDTHIKGSAKFFVDQLDPTYDRVGVIRYDRWGWEPPNQSMALSHDFAAIKNGIDSLTAFEPYGVLCTNIGDGILYANHYMSVEPPPGGVGGRDDAVWAIVLLTDGRANMYRDCPGCPDDCGSCSFQECSHWSGVCDQAGDWAIANAWSSWNNHKIVVYTIAYGDIFFDHPEYRQLMRDIADITDNGSIDGTTENFWAVPDETGLRQALAEIAERIYTRLVQ